MSKKKERTNIKLGYLNEINYIDRRLKRKKVQCSPSEVVDKLLKERESLTSKLKTKR